MALDFVLSWERTSLLIAFWVKCGHFGDVFNKNEIKTCYFFYEAYNSTIFRARGGAAW